MSALQRLSLGLASRLRLGMQSRGALQAAARGLATRGGDSSDEEEGPSRGRRRRRPDPRAAQTPAGEEEGGDYSDEEDIQELLAALDERDEDIFAPEEAEGAEGQQPQELPDPGPDAAVVLSAELRQLWEETKVGGEYCFAACLRLLPRGLVLLPDSRGAPPARPHACRERGTEAGMPCAVRRRSVPLQRSCECCRCNSAFRAAGRSRIRLYLRAWAQAALDSNPGAFIDRIEREEAEGNTRELSGRTGCQGGLTGRAVQGPGGPQAAVGRQAGVAEQLGGAGKPLGEQPASTRAHSSARRSWRLSAGSAGVSRGLRAAWLRAGAWELYP